MNFENALISRRIVNETDDAVTIMEVWDTSHPESPYVCYPRDGKMPNPYYRDIRMSRAEYDNIKPPLKDGG